MALVHCNNGTAVYSLTTGPINRTDVCFDLKITAENSCFI